MPEASTAAHALVRPLPDARVFSSAVAVAQCQLDGASLAEYFVSSLGYGWRANFAEPSLDDLRGLGATLLPFDF
jgi:hypothetical protein